MSPEKQAHERFTHGPFRSTVHCPLNPDLKAGMIYILNHSILQGHFSKLISLIEIKISF